MDTRAMGAALVMAALTAGLQAQSPTETRGLILWLDAADQAAIDRDADGRVSLWRDKSAQANHAVPGASDKPAWIAEGLLGKASVRFSGQSCLKTGRPLADGPGSLTLFVVFERHPDQETDRKWQRILSCWDGKSDGDNKRPSFQICTKEGTAQKATILNQLLSQAHRGLLWIGTNSRARHQSLHGDIAEILIYDHGFLVDEQIQKVKAYLRGKWGIPEDPDAAWTRQGILAETPVRKSDGLPLSDQENQGEWAIYAPMTDEFEGPRLDTDRWWDHNPRWYGRAPSRYLGEGQNVSTAGGGMLHITMKRDDSLPRAKLYNNGAFYENYSAGSVVSKEPVLYGYFEIRSRAMSSAGSSAFWFSGKVRHLKSGKPYRSEIDVFEIGGKAPGHEKAYHMNAHIFETPADGVNHWSKGGTWEAPFRFADDFHVFALEWGSDTITYYVDGVPVRRMKNTHWHAPMFLIFDSETMGSWLGMPNDEDLPSAFSIDYVRAWKNAETLGKWQSDYETIGDPRKPTAVTHYVRSLDTHGK